MYSTARARKKSAYETGAVTRFGVKQLKAKQAMIHITENKSNADFTFHSDFERPCKSKEDFCCETLKLLRLTFFIEENRDTYLSAQY